MNGVPSHELFPINAANSQHRGARQARRVSRLDFHWLAIACQKW